MADLHVRRMRDKFKYFVLQQVSALRVLRQANLPLAYLTILYTTIDMFSFIWAGGDDNQAGIRFRDFTDRYIIKHLPGLSSYDLWGARCAILHTASPESTASKKGHARQMLYCWGRAKVDILKKIISSSPCPGNYAGVSLQDLEQALSNGLCEFSDDLEQNTNLKSCCEPRFNDIYSIMNFQSQNKEK